MFVWLTITPFSYCGARHYNNKRERLSITARVATALCILERYTVGSQPLTAANMECCSTSSRMLASVFAVVNATSHPESVAPLDPLCVTGSAAGIQAPLPARHKNSPSGKRQIQTGRIAGAHVNRPNNPVQVRRYRSRERSISRYATRALSTSVREYMKHDWHDEAHAIE